MTAIQIYWLISGICAVGVIVFVMVLIVLSWMNKPKPKKRTCSYYIENGEHKMQCWRE